MVPELQALPMWSPECDLPYIEQPDYVRGGQWRYDFAPCAYCGRRDDPDSMSNCIGCGAHRTRAARVDAIAMLDRVLRLLR